MAAGLTQALIADQEGLGHHSANYARTEGSGRNNALYELKKKLFYEGLDENDPEMRRRIYEANDQFPEPLDEDEVGNTVQRIKGWNGMATSTPSRFRWLIRTFPQAVRFLDIRKL